MLIITIILISTGTKLKILSDHKGWVNGVAWAKQDPFSDIASNGRGNLASLASDRCLRVYNAGTKNFKNIARTHRCKLRVPSSKKSAEELTISENSPGKVSNVNSFDANKIRFYFTIRFNDMLPYYENISK